DVGGAAAAGAGPGGLGPAARARVPHQRGAADGGHVGGGGRVLHAEAGVAAAGHNCHALVVVVLLEVGLARELRSAVAVGDLGGAERRGGVGRGGQAGGGGGARLDQQQLAVRAHRRG